jgi:hypothetical protein
MAEMQMETQKQDKELAFKAQQAELDRQNDIQIEQMKIQSNERIKAMELMVHRAGVDAMTADQMLQGAVQERAAYGGL